MLLFANIVSLGESLVDVEEERLPLLLSLSLLLRLKVEELKLAVRAITEEKENVEYVALYREKEREGEVVSLVSP